MEAVAKLRNVPTSPRKMRLVANLVRGKRVTQALGLLRFEANSGAERVEKLLLSALANWQQKNADERIEDANLYVTEISVDEGRQLKRLRPAPQGRGHSWHRAPSRSPESGSCQLQYASLSGSES
jgi:large subunit ribosomal protein L22